MLHGDPDGRLGIVGERPGEHLVEDHPERVQVAPGADRLAHRLLGGDVVGGSQYGAGLGHSARGCGARDPEVPDLDVSGARHEDVVGLYVTMHDALGVCGLQGLGDLERHGRRRSWRESTPFEDPVLQGAAGQILHRDVIRVARVLAPVVNRDDVRMREGRSALRLALEAFDELRVVGVAATHDLERHVAI